MDCSVRYIELPSFLFSGMIKFIHSDSFNISHAQWRRPRKNRIYRKLDQRIHDKDVPAVDVCMEIIGLRY